MSITLDELRKKFIVDDLGVIDVSKTGGGKRWTKWEDAYLKATTFTKPREIQESLRYFGYERTCGAIYARYRAIRRRNHRGGE